VGQLTARPKGSGAGRERDARAASDLQTRATGVTPGSLRVVEDEAGRCFLPSGPAHQERHFEAVGLLIDAAETQRHSVRVD